MDDLITKLETEAGLTHEQAIKVISVMKDYMDNEGMDVDWEKFFKGKYKEFLSKTKAFYNNYTQHAEDYSYKIADKVEDMAIQAKRTARDISKKASDLLKNEE
ncbi:MAG: hypothetical protein ACLVKO_08505 [Dysgonomonas sp.]